MDAYRVIERDIDDPLDVHIVVYDQKVDTIRYVPPFHPAEDDALCRYDYRMAWRILSVIYTPISPNGQVILQKEIDDVWVDYDLISKVDDLVKV